MTPKRLTLSWYLDRFSPPEGILLLILSMIVGATTGLASVFFVKLIFAIQDFSYGSILAVDIPITVFPDEPIWAAIQKMSPRDLARLPVVLRDGSKTLCGIISRSDILRAYDVGDVITVFGRLKDIDGIKDFLNSCRLPDHLR